MADLEGIPMCCGIHELGFVRDDQTPEDSLMSFNAHDLCAHVLFSVTSAETKMHKKGHDLANYIIAHGLGEIVTTGARKNPGHSGTLKAWLWTPNKTALRALQKNLKETNKRFRNANISNPESRDPYGW